MLNTDLIARAEAFLKETFASSEYLQSKPDKMDYQLAHAYRVANIAKEISEAEDDEFCDPTLAVIACLLHDIAYCEEMVTFTDVMNRGRRGAEIVRPFLEELGISSNSINDICYGIATHVDDKSSFEWESSPISEMVCFADQLDHLNTYHIHNTYNQLMLNKHSLSDKRKKVSEMIIKLEGLKKMKSGASVANQIWRQRLDFHIAFYKVLEAELATSDSIL